MAADAWVHGVALPIGLCVVPTLSLDDSEEPDEVPSRVSGYLGDLAELLFALRIVSMGS